MSKETQIYAAEYPDSTPYEFEGYIDEFGFEFGLASDEEFVSTLAPKVGLGVVRAGQNAHGTWGYLAKWNGSKWEGIGYTLEPRSNVGKGPIPLGDFPFRRWISPRLKKTLRLANVPGFTDILIHVGNTQGDTQGCILAAKRVDNLKSPTRLVDSRSLTNWLYDNCQDGVVLVRAS